MKVLIITDNIEQGTHLQNLFRANFPKIKTIVSENSEKAVDDILMDDELYLFTIIDCAHRGEEPTDIYQTVRELRENSAIVMLGPKALIQSRAPANFYDQHDANSALISPIDAIEFRKVVTGILLFVEKEQIEEATFEAPKKNFLQVKIRNFFYFNKFSYDVFFEVSDNRFLKIIHKDEKYAPDLILKYARKRAKYLYLEKEDHLKYLETSAALAVKAFTEPHMSDDQRIAHQIRGISIILEHIRTIGVSEIVITLTNELIQSASRMFEKYKDLQQILNQFKDDDKDVPVQALMTLYVCEAIVHELGWKADITRGKLGLASVIHDVFVFDEDLLKIRSIKDPHLKDFDPRTVDEFKLHPKKSGDFAAQFNGYSDVDFIVREHHERPDGKGFPAGSNSTQLTALSCLFILANNFVLEISGRGISKKSIATVLAEFGEDYQMGNFRDPLKALVKALS